MTLDLTSPEFHDEDMARRWLETSRWPNGPYCPHCGSTGVTRLHGEKHRAGCFQCNDCRGQFTVLTGSVMESSHAPLTKWVLAIRLMTASKKGMSAHQMHRMLSVTYKTAWFMCHRIREAMKDPSPAPLGGDGKRPIFALVERGGEARAMSMPMVTGKNVREAIVRNAHRTSRLQTDESPLYNAVGSEFVKHETVYHAAHDYAHGDVTTNSVEGFFGIFKRGMVGIYQHCGEQHLQRYLDEFTFRYNNRSKLGVEDRERAVIAAYGMGGKRLTYRRIDAA